MANTSPARISTVRVAPKCSTLPSARSTQLRPSAPSAPPRASLESGEFVELPVQPTPPSIIVSMCYHANAEMLVRAAADSARRACTGYCAQVDQRYIEAVC